MFLAGIPVDFILFALTVPGLLQLLRHEWMPMANLSGLLPGFALLSDHFEKSWLPAILPRYLRDDWRGGFVMLAPGS